MFTRRSLLTLIGLLPFAACGPRTQGAARTNAGPRLTTVTLAISGMT